MALKDLIRSIPDFPKPGIVFRDVTTIFKDPQGFREAVDVVASRYLQSGITKVAGIEARGFILGAAVAYRLGAGFVPVRKQGKLPAATIGQDYTLEYGMDRVEVHTDAIGRGDRVLLVDDLIATGGTALAAVRLVSVLGGEMVACAFLVDLPELGGRRRLEAEGHDVFSVLEFDGH